MSKSELQPIHLETIRHRDPLIRKSTAEEAGHYSRIAHLEIDILVKALDLEVAIWKAVMARYIDDDLQSIEGVIQAICSALGRCAAVGADLSEAHHILCPLVRQNDSELLKLSAAFALGAEKRFQARQGERKAA